MKNDSRGKAREQVNLAEDRTALAVERTFNSWFKTSIALFAGGLGIAKVMQGSNRFPQALMVSVMMMAMALIAAIYSAHRYRLATRRLRTNHLPPCPSWMVYLLVIGFALIATIGAFMILAG